jgi:hypothetical protein
MSFLAVSPRGLRIVGFIFLPLIMIGEFTFLSL